MSLQYKNSFLLQAQSQGLVEFRLNNVNHNYAKHGHQRNMPEELKETPHLGLFAPYLSLSTTLSHTSRVSDFTVYSMHTNSSERDECALAFCLQKLKACPKAQKRLDCMLTYSKMANDAYSNHDAHPIAKAVARHCPRLKAIAICTDKN